MGFFNLHLRSSGAILWIICSLLTFSLAPGILCEFSCLSWSKLMWNFSLLNTCPVYKKSTQCFDMVSTRIHQTIVTSHHNKTHYRIQCINAYTHIFIWISTSNAHNPSGVLWGHSFPWIYAILHPLIQLKVNILWWYCLLSCGICFRCQPQRGRRPRQRLSSAENLWKYISYIFFHITQVVFILCNC
jgi:hypothetical protein